MHFCITFCNSETQDYQVKPKKYLHFHIPRALKIELFMLQKKTGNDNMTAEGLLQNSKILISLLGSTSTLGTEESVFKWNILAHLIYQYILRLALGSHKSLKQKAVKSFTVNKSILLVRMEQYSNILTLFKSTAFGSFKFMFWCKIFKQFHGETPQHLQEDKIF